MAGLACDECGRGCVAPVDERVLCATCIHVLLIQERGARAAEVAAHGREVATLREQVDAVNVAIVAELDAVDAACRLHGYNAAGSTSRAEWIAVQLSKLQALQELHASKVEGG